MNSMNFGPEYSNNISRAYTIEEVKRAIDNKTVMEAVVDSCDSSLALSLDIGNNIVGRIAFDNLEYRMDGKPVKSITAMSKVGRHVKFIPVSVSGDINSGYTVVCSRRLAQKECYEHYLSKLIPGTIVDVRVIATKTFGVFCDIGCGVIALLPTNLISVTHIADPTLLFKDTPNIKAVVKNVQSDGKVQLSHRELLGTWDQEVSKLTAGSTICGTVISVEPYGVFVRVTQNISGLASTNHIEPEKVELKPGDVVSVRVRSTSQKPGKSRRVKLSIIEKIDDATENLKFKYYKTDDLGDSVESYGAEFKGTCLENSKYIKNWTYASDVAKPIVSDFETEVNELTGHKFID